jgi:activator of HSP90 ATPase
MAHEFTVTATIPATPREVYDAWLSSKGHGAMTGSPARGSAHLGGEFTAWDGYITAKNLKLIAGRRIVQAWRTTEFSTADPDSQIDVLLEKAPGGTRLTPRHTNIPDGHTTYDSGWRGCYFEPMMAYFTQAKNTE